MSEITSPINKTFLSVTAVIAAILFLYAQVLTKLGYDWWTDENYSHGLLVPFVIGFIVWTEWDGLKASIREPAVLVGGGLVIFAILLQIAGTLGAELFTRRISLVVMFAGILIYFSGRGF